MHKSDRVQNFKKRIEGKGESLSPKSHSENILEIAMMIAGAWNMTIFDVLKQDIDTFILISNYLIELGDKEHSKPINQNRAKASNERIKVNDSTATGGWF